jgi:hypothetical protein
VFAVAGDPRQVARALLGRFGDLVTRMSLYTPYAAEPEDIAAVVAALRAAPAR